MLRPVVRPRFWRLPEAQRTAITVAAADEFARLGFHDASLNRIIEAAGVSKGSMYYYVDGKEDLFAHVVSAEVTTIVESLGPFTIPDTRDAGTFWASLTHDYLRIMQALAERPTAAALLRGWIAATASSPTLQEAQAAAMADFQPWLARAVEAGVAAGAVRADVPPGLVRAVVAGIGQAVDLWLIEEAPGPEQLPELVEQGFGMMRRALAPDA